MRKTVATSRREDPAAKAARQRVEKIKEKDRLAKEAIQKKLDKAQEKRQREAVAVIEGVRLVQLARRQRKKRKEEKARQRQEAFSQKQRDFAQRRLQEFEERRRINAATKIQSAWRGYKARRLLHSEKMEKQRHKERNAMRKRAREFEAKKQAAAATKIQSARRGQLARRRASRLLEEKKDAKVRKQRQAHRDKIRQKNEEKVATMIQKVFRGKQGRASVNQKREDIAYTNYMASTFGLGSDVKPVQSSRTMPSSRPTSRKASDEFGGASLHRDRVKTAEGGSRRPSFSFVRKWEQIDIGTQTTGDSGTQTDVKETPASSQGLDFTFGGRSRNIDEASALLSEAEYRAEMQRRQQDRRSFQARFREAQHEENRKLRAAEKTTGLANLFSKLSARAERQKRIEEKALHDQVAAMYAKKMEEMMDRSAINSAIFIQKHRRGQLARRRYTELQQERWSRKVEEDRAKRAFYEQMAQAERAAYLQKEREKERQKARWRLQEMYVERRSHAALMIQRIWRGKVSRRMYNFEKDNILRAQRIAERDKAWQLVQQMTFKQRDFASIVIQKARRGQLGRRIARKERSQRDRITKEKRLKKEREAAARKYAELQRQRLEEAAIRIQTKFRGRKARREFMRQQKQLEKKRYEQDVIRTLELRRIREGARHAGAEMNFSADLRVVRDAHKRKEENIMQWLQEEEEVWKWCLEQEARYAALRQAADAGDESRVLAKHQQEARMWDIAGMPAATASAPSQRVGRGKSTSKAAPRSTPGIDSLPVSPSDQRQHRPDLHQADHSSAAGLTPSRLTVHSSNFDRLRGIVADTDAAVLGAQHAAEIAAHEAAEAAQKAAEAAEALNYQVLREEERRNIKGIQLLLKKQRTEMTQQKFFIGQVRHEFSMLRLVVTLGDEGHRCHKCDMGLATLQVLLQALERVISLVQEFRQVDDTSENRRAILKQLLELMAGAAQVDPQAKEVADSLASRLAETEVEEEEEEEEEEPPQPVPRVFEGYWAKEDSSSQYFVKGSELHWLDSGSVYKFADLGEKRCAMDIVGDTYTGRLIGKDCISWSDGSFWVRADGKRSLSNM